MRKTVHEKLEAGRFLTGEYGSPRGNLWGAFKLMGPCGATLMIVASDGGGEPPYRSWEHVSISTRHRCPNWIEMCFVKDLFWEPEECVVQYHPPVSEYINNHPYTLHLWRHQTLEFPKPPKDMVGVESDGPLTKEQAERVRHKLLGRET